MSDFNTICDSEVGIVDSMAEFDKNWRFSCAGDVEADPVRGWLHKLIRNRNISKDQIFYKYLDNMTKIYYDIVYGPIGFGNKVLQTKFVWTWVGL